MMIIVHELRNHCKLFDQLLNERVWLSSLSFPWLAKKGTVQTSASNLVAPIIVFVISGDRNSIRSTQCQECRLNLTALLHPLCEAQSVSWQLEFCLYFPYRYECIYVDNS